MTFPSSVQSSVQHTTMDRHIARSSVVIAACALMLVPGAAVADDEEASGGSQKGYADEVGATGSITITRHINKARAASASDPKTAKKHYVQAIELSPKSAEFMSEYYKLCLKTRDLGGIIYVLEKWFAVDPSKQKEYYASYGLALAQSGKIDKAVPVLKKALSYGKDLGSAHEGLLRAYLAQGNTESAMREYRETLRLKPSDGDLHGEFAALLWKQNKLSEAIEQYRAMARLKPNDAPSQAALGFGLMQSQDYAGAYAAYRRAAELAPAVAAYRTSMNQAFTYEQKYSQALKKKGKH